MKNKNKHLLLLISLLIITPLILIGCKSDNNKTDGLENTKDQQTEEVDYSKADNPVATIEMENGDKIEVELYPELAPNTVNNFISLANKGYYNGLIFHRVMEGFMIQGGDPDGTGMGGPGYGIKGEFKSNGVENNLKHSRGVISMARTQDYDGAGSQFFIMVEDSEHLDGDYAAFGKTISGMETADKIVSTETDANDKPIEAQTIKELTVDLKEKTYDEPQIIE